MRTGLAALATLLLATALGACGSDDGSGGGSGETASGARASASATPTSVAEVLQIGRPVAVAEDGAGRVLVAHLVEDGPRTSVAAAWRLQDADGEVIAEGPGRQVRNEGSIPGVWPLADGFLVDLGGNGRYELLDADGELSPVEEVDTPRAPGPGDVAVEGARGVYSPSEGTIAPTPPLPGGAVAVELVIDADGGAWALPESGASPSGAVLLHLPAGATTWQESPLELPARGYPIGLAATDDLVVVPVAVTRGAGDQLDALLVRSRADADATWRRLEAPDGLGSSWFSATVEGLPDGRLLVFDDVDVAQVVDPEDDSWEELALPAAGNHGWALELAGERLYALDWVGGAAYVSTDLGGEWTDLAG